MAAVAGPTYLRPIGRAARGEDAAAEPGLQRVGLGDILHDRAAGDDD
jgi:hypothetical protein